MLKRTMAVAALIALVAAVAPHAQASPAANTVAVCGCGMVFTPNASTKYLEYGGKSYACCTEGCHKMSSANPAVGAKMAEEATARFMSKSRVNLAVANVLSVDQTGTHALCGCGKEFNLAADTPFLKAGDKTYACCSKACHDMVKDKPAEAAKMFEAKLAEHTH